MEERTVIQPRPLGSVEPGTRLNGIYQIEKMIAQGGMGEVYRGFNIQTADIVAIKMIRPEFSDNDEVMELFRREASILHNLVHEAIVRYFLFSVDPVIGRAYLAMEFVDGPSLRDRLTSGPLSLPDVTILRKRIASALETAHRLGVVHRDISSDNFILPNADVRNAKIIDFGIARSLEVGKKTIIGSGFAGKYNYVSPEQLGMAGGDVTAKSDIYSFGLVLAEAARGHALDMNGSQAEVIDKRRVVPDLSDIDPTIRPQLQAMLQPRPENRPASMAAIAEWTELAAPAPPARRGKVWKSAARPAATAEQPRESPAGVSPPLSAPSSHSRASGASLSSSSTISRSGHRVPARSGAPTASAPPPLPSLPSKRLAEASRPAAEAPAESAKLPPLAAPSAPQTPPPAPASPPAAPPAEAEQTASLPPAKMPNAAGSPRRSPIRPRSMFQPPWTFSKSRRPARHRQKSTCRQRSSERPTGPNFPVSLTTAARTFVCRPNSVPDGLSFHDLGEGKGLIDGAPALAGEATMRVEAVNPGGRSAQMVANLVIANKPQQAPAERTRPGSTSRAQRRADGAAGGCRGRRSQSPALKRPPSVRTTAPICLRSAAARPRRR